MKHNHKLVPSWAYLLPIVKNKSEIKKNLRNAYMNGIQNKSAEYILDFTTLEFIKQTIKKREKKYLYIVTKYNSYSFKHEVHLIDKRIS